MQTSAELQTQIDQVEREVKDITASLKKLTKIQDLLDAHGELTNRAQVLSLLEERLQDAQQEEAAAAERARRQANTDAMEAAKTAHKEVSERINARKLALVRHLTAESDELEPLYWEAQRLRNEFVEAWLQNNPEKRREDSFLWPKVPDYPLDLTEPEKHANDALNILYASRHKLPDSYDNLMTLSAGANYLAFQNRQPQQQLSDPVTPVADALDFLDRRANGGDD